MESSSIIKDRLSHPGFRKYFRNTSWLFIGRFFSLVVNFLVGTYIARYLGPGLFGQMNYVISFASLFTAFASFGIDPIIVRSLTSNPDQQGLWLGTAFITKLTGATFTIVIASLASLFLGHDPFTSVLVFTFVLSTAFQALFVTDLFFQSKVQSDRSTKVNIAVVIIVSLLKLVFIWLHLGLFYFIAIYLVDNLLMALGLIWWYYRSNHSLTSWHFSGESLRYALSRSWPFLLSSICAGIYFRIDQVLLGNWFNQATVGYYAAAVRLTEVWVFIPGILTLSLFPALVNAKKTNDSSYRRRVASLYSFMFYVALAIALGTTVFSPFLIHLLYGNGFEATIPVLQIYIWAIVGLFLTNLTTQYLFIDDFLFLTFFVNFIGAAANVILNLILIPRFGLFGAAWASVLSYSVPFFSLFFFAKTRDLGKLFISGITFRFLSSK
ncbi:MAG: flippase [bacterium]